MSCTEDFISVKPNGEKLNQFMNYFADNYIGPQSDFPSHTWANMSSSSEQTTDVCEDIHSKYDSCFIHLIRISFLLRNLKKNKNKPKHFDTNL
jgi:hypothetical protein